MKLVLRRERRSSRSRGQNGGGTFDILSRCFYLPMQRMFVFMLQDVVLANVQEFQTNVREYGKYESVLQVYKSFTFF